MTSDLITVEFSKELIGLHPNIYIEINGAKLEALFLQLNNDDLVKLGHFPQSNDNKMFYDTAILNYMIRLLEVIIHARFRKAEDLLYNKIQNLVYDKDDISNEDVQTIINDMKILKIASQ